ncbi:ABC transporter permease [Streptomyces meridianus]|uniref:ABC transporter permease n=1 Tax=Streptomyces meridianus TaxID=2938945 RepID=A0ABT0X5D9_9ACTN|nr:ABC transporter permease [Streptomyces meridianus]MCM2577751.1 ABC transporter permease [Streptomyces meridianus]
MTALTARPAATGPLAGTLPLARLALRRDRLMVPAWVLGLGLMTVGGASSIAALYDTPASRIGLARSMAGNGSLRALYGPVFDASTTGGLTAWRFGVFGAALAGLMGILLVVRHTRDEEEAGRLELVGAAAVGRRAPLTAALLTASGAGIALGLLVAVGLCAQGEGVAGSFALGLAFTLSTVVFASLAGVTAQLAETGRAARSLAGTVLGLAFLLRAAGDSAQDGGPSWLVWASPLGWTEQLRPFADERWWVVPLLLGAASALTAVAHALVARRDLDAGLLASRPGPATASRRLSGPFGLAWRLQRGSLYGWAAGFAVAGLAFGSLADGVADLIRDNARLADVFRRIGGAQQLTDTYLASMVSLLAMLASVYTVQSVLRLHGEETSGRAEPVLAGAVSRLRWAASHLVPAGLGGLALLLVAGLSLGLGHGATGGDLPGQASRMTGAALVLAPAVWFTGATAFVLHGVVPRAAGAAWGLLGFFLLVGLYGPVLDLPRPVLDLSPFSHLPKVPAEDPTALPLIVLGLLAAALTAVGAAGLRRRDLG